MHFFRLHKKSFFFKLQICLRLLINSKSALPNNFRRRFCLKLMSATGQTELDKCRRCLPQSGLTMLWVCMKVAICFAYLWHRCKIGRTATQITVKYDRNVWLLSVFVRLFVYDVRLRTPTKRVGMYSSVKIWLWAKERESEGGKNIVEICKSHNWIKIKIASWFLSNQDLFENIAALDTHTQAQVKDKIFWAQRRQKTFWTNLLPRRLPILSSRFSLWNQIKKSC